MNERGWAIATPLEEVAEAHYREGLREERQWQPTTATFPESSPRFGVTACHGHSSGENKPAAIVVSATLFPARRASICLGPAGAPRLLMVALRRKDECSTTLVSARSLPPHL